MGELQLISFLTPHLYKCRNVWCANVCSKKHGTWCGVLLRHFYEFVKGQLQSESPNVLIGRLCKFSMRHM